MQCDENASRAPENPEMLLWVSRALDYWSREYYRRRNSDESLCPAVEFAPLPDTLEVWQQERVRIRQLFEEHIYGAIPPGPDQLDFRVLSCKDGALGGLAKRWEIRVYCRMNNRSCHDFDMLLYVPENCSKPPVFVGLNFDGNQANTPEDDVRLTRGPSRTPGRWWRTVAADGSKRNIKLDSWNFEETVKRGYAVATADYGEIFPDNPCGYEKSIYRLFYAQEELVGLAEPTAPPKKFGAISAWAWGLSRMLDVLEKFPAVDANRAAVIGHSRLGKTALWAGACDERFKLVISNNSGCLGAAPSRREFGERLGHLSFIQRFWFVDTLCQYAFREEFLPVEQHQLLALIAPRSLYVASSSEDFGADPCGEFLSAQAASAAWKLYGLQGIAEQKMPPLNQSVGDRVRYHIKAGGHSITAVDWQHYYDCADALWKTQKK